MRASPSDQPSASPQPTEVLAGSIERVTFHSAETGFCVLRIKARGHRDLVTVVGHAAEISAGEWVTVSGCWVNSREHGQQFKASFLKASAPTSAEGIEKYLGSGMIRGIGPIYASKLVATFGDQVFKVIEQAPERLREVPGIGPVRGQRISKAWADQKMVREIMVFLHSHGVGTARAVRIFKTYGNNAVQVMAENPYRLARDIRGIGFRTADAIAARLGIEPEAMIRLRAGINYALLEASGQGHCGLPSAELLSLAGELLAVERPGGPHDETGVSKRVPLGACRAFPQAEPLLPPLLGGEIGELLSTPGLSGTEEWAPPQAAASAARCSLPMLWVMAIRVHSPSTFSSPRSRKRSRPRAPLI